VNRRQFAKLIDHTQLRAYASEVDIKELCDKAVRYGFASVAINPVWTSYCARFLKGTGILVDPCIGFPLGANTAHIKIEETREAIRNGANEVDMVINIGALKSGYRDYVEKEIAAVVKAAGDIPVKVILETSYLSDDEKIEVCEMSLNARAAFVKTSTGFGQGGATVDDVRLMYRLVGNQMGIKAAGGIRTYEDIVPLVKAGATRIGTSAGVDIIESYPGD
jgi:deoxyribose-phosphate aldolase